MARQSETNHIHSNSVIRMDMEYFHKTMAITFMVVAVTVDPRYNCAHTNSAYNLRKQTKFYFVKSVSYTHLRAHET